MNSTTSSSSGFFSSPSRERRLLWISGAVLLIGVVVFLAVFLSRSGSAPATSAVLPGATTSSHSIAPTPKRVAPSPAAFKVARTFLQTAVLRKNLDSAYRIVGPDIKGGLSLRQWRTGSIPVTPFPARNAKTASFVVKSSTKSQLMLQVVLSEKPGAHAVRPSLAFWLGVDRIGGRWLVNYWLPDYSIPVKANPNN